MSQTRIENRLCNGLFSPSEWNAAWRLCALSYIRRQKEKGRSANVREKIADTTEKNGDRQEKLPRKICAATGFM